MLQQLSQATTTSKVKVVRVFNNNAIAIITHENKEAVALGSGIGFGKKPNDSVLESKIEKIYYIQDKAQEKFLDLLKETDFKYVVLAEEILKKANELGFETQHSAIIALTDHISFAIERATSGVVLPNLILNELKLLYKDEFKIGEWSLELINKKTGVTLPIEEAGYIALHIIQTNNVQTPENTLKTVSFVQTSICLIEDIYRLHFVEGEFNYSRLTIHLKFLAQRVLNCEKVELNVNKDMFNYFINANPLHKQFAIAFDKEIRSVFNCKISKEEVLYIIIHITKFIK